jgi:uncharacterized damage-inducible protein DinB
MATTDPFIESAKTVYALAFNDMRTAIESCPDDALNERPAGQDSNSIAVLAIHSLSSTRSWLSVATTGGPWAGRDRDAEFRVESASKAALLSAFDELGADCQRLLDDAEVRDWAAQMPTHARPGTGTPDSVPAAWALLHALEHLREHVGHMTLTVQVFEQRAATG